MVRRAVSPLISVLILILIAILGGLMVYYFIFNYTGSIEVSSGRILDMLTYDCSVIVEAKKVVEICIRNLGGKEVALDEAYIVYGDQSSSKAYIGQVGILTITYTFSGGEVVEKISISDIPVYSGPNTIQIEVFYSSDDDNSDTKISIYITFESDMPLTGVLINDSLTLPDGGNSVSVELFGILSGSIEGGYFLGGEYHLDPFNVTYVYLIFDKIYLGPGSVLRVDIWPIEGVIANPYMDLSIRVTTREGGILIVNIG